MKKVLLVEDDPFIRDLTTIKLSEHRYEVLPFENGTDALAYMDAHMPDVVLLDLDLPDIHGLEILTRVRASVRLKDLPVIIFSNRDDEETKGKASALGATGFFVKASTDYSELFEQIDSLPSA